ncbi:MAG: antibiotic biosynthesis monooxygenase family protein [Desulfobacterales bacterium]
MAVKVLIKRVVPENKTKEVMPLFRKMRSLAVVRRGYISGETLRSLDRPDVFLVISNWKSSDDWEEWLSSEERRSIQREIDEILGGHTDYEVFHYGFAE